MKRFIPPTEEEVKEYANSIGFKSLNAGLWWHHYDAKNWMIGKNKMARWKSAVWTWFYDTHEYREIQRKKKENQENNRRLKNEYRNYILDATEIKLIEMRKAKEWWHLWWLIDELRPEIKGKCAQRADIKRLKG